MLRFWTNCLECWTNISTLKYPELFPYRSARFGVGYKFSMSELVALPITTMVCRRAMMLSSGDSVTDKFLSHGVK